MKSKSSARRPVRADAKSGARAAVHTNGATPPPVAAAARKPRGRPRSFDRAQALEAAIEVFWAKGYEATSISDLTAAMGINPPSLYAAFGDKERLFLEAVERYEASQGDSCPYCSEPTARGAFEKLLTYLADELTSSEHPRGCMLMMAATTANSASVELQNALAKRRAESRAGMKARLEKGIEDGDVPPGTDVAAISDFFATIIAGMALQAREGATKKSLMGTVERAMSVFPPVGKRGAKSAAMRKKETA